MRALWGLMGLLVVALPAFALDDATRHRIFCHYQLKDTGTARMYEDRKGQLYPTMEACRASAPSCQVSAREMLMTYGEWLKACAGVPRLGPPPTQ